MNISIVLSLIVILSIIGLGIYYWFFWRKMCKDGKEWDKVEKKCKPIIPTCEADEYLDETTNTCAKEPYKIGSTVRCETNDPLNNPLGSVYRYDGKKTLRHYSTPEIAQSWDPNWVGVYEKIPDCAEYIKGETMQKKV